MKPKPKPTQAKHRSQLPPCDHDECSKLKCDQRRKLAKAIANKLLGEGIIVYGDHNEVMYHIEQLLKKHGPKVCQILFLGSLLLD